MNTITQQFTTQSNRLNRTEQTSKEKDMKIYCQTPTTKSLSVPHHCIPHSFHEQINHNTYHTDLTHESKISFDN